MAKRKKNPNTGAWVFGAVIATGFLYWSYKKTWGKQRNYVGSGWSWPDKDTFPTTRSFGEALNTLGYGAAVGMPGWEILSVESMETVKQFQRDFNTLRKWAKSVGATIGKKLEVDGLIGSNTIGALKFALEQNQEDSWIALVNDARKAMESELA